MKATGIVRRIDELGRVVIPKEIRRTMHLKEGEELEIFTNENSELIFKKYSSINMLETLTKEYCNLINQAVGESVLICNSEVVVDGVGKLAKYFIGKRLTNAFFGFVASRKGVLISENELQSIVFAQPVTPQNIIIAPIIKNGDIYGSIIVMSEFLKLTTENLNLCITAGEFIACSI